MSYLSSIVHTLCRKANILHLTAAGGTGALLYHLIQKFPDISMKDLDTEGNNLLHAAASNTSHHHEVLDLLLRVFPLKKTSIDSKYECDS